jgi:NADH-quinone oxidoreductase subunit N
MWGCFAALSERKTKRFLAFASINQIGFILLGLASASFEGYRAALFYIIIYTIINLAFLTVFLQARRADQQSLLYLTDFRGFGQKYSAYSWSIAIVLLSIAGIPPLAGFFGKYYLLLHAQEQGFYALVVTALFTSLISTYYYLRIIKIIWFEASDNKNSVACELSQPKAVAMHVAEWSLWGFIVYASGILQIIDRLLESLLAVQ